jgi:hypothetical protein
VDPHIFHGESGLPDDPGGAEESVNYLRRLRGSATEGAPADGDRGSADGGAKTGGTPTSISNIERIGGKERRRSPRFRCSGSAEFRAEGNDLKLWGTVTDICRDGCYIEMHTTFPVGTRVGLILKSCGIRIQTAGTVRATYPFLGMGLSFSDIEPAQDQQLKQLLDTLSGPGAVSRNPPAPQTDAVEILAAADPAALLNEIKDFFRTNQQLSREEFHTIAKWVRRS